MKQIIKNHQNLCLITGTKCRWLIDCDTDAITTCISHDIKLSHRDLTRLVDWTALVS